LIFQECGLFVNCNAVATTATCFVIV
jgi:hypothetical protein